MGPVLLAGRAQQRDGVSFKVDVLLALLMHDPACMQALWALVIGLQLSLSSLALGHWTALCVHRWLLREGRAGNASRPQTAAPHREPRNSQGQPPSPLTNGGTSHDQQPGQQSALSPRAGSSLHGVLQQPNGGIELAAVEPAAADTTPHTPRVSPAEQCNAQTAAYLRTGRGQLAAAEKSSAGAQPRNGSERRWSLEEVEEGLPGSGNMDEEEREDVAEEEINSGAVPWCDRAAYLLSAPALGIDICGPTKM